MAHVTDELTDGSGDQMTGHIVDIHVPVWAAIADREKNRKSLVSGSVSGGGRGDGGSRSGGGGGGGGSKMVSAESKIISSR